MRRVILIIFSFFFLSTNYVTAQDGRNLSFLYSKLLGYEYKNQKTKLPNGEWVDAWDFYRGKVGKEYSYCAQKGYKTKVKNSRKEGKVDGVAAFCYKEGKEEKHVLSLIYENGDYATLFANTTGAPPPPPPDSLPIPVEGPDIEGSPSYPTNFFLGEYVNLNTGMDQENSNLCYAYAASLVASDTYERNTGIDIGLSSSSIGYCGRNCYPSIIDGYMGISTDYAYYALKFCVEQGVATYDDFPQYNGPNGDDPALCTTVRWGSTRYKFNDYATLGNADLEAIQSALYTYGPVLAVMEKTYLDGYPDGSSLAHIEMDNGRYCIEDYYSDCALGSNSMHAVAIVGWGHDDEVGMYWIIANSVGAGWGYDGGLGYLKANSCKIMCRCSHLIYSERKISVPINGQCGDLSVSSIITTAPQSYEWIVGDPTLYNSLPSSPYGTMINLDVKSTASDWDDITFKINYDSTSCSPAFTEELEKTVWIGGPPACPINGSSSIDAGDTELYYVTWDGVQVESIQWSVAPTSDYSIEGSSTTSGVTIRASSYGGSEGTLTALLTSNCGTRTETKTISINGGVIPDVQLVCTTTDPCASPQTYELQPVVPGLGNVLWSYSGNLSLSPNGTSCDVTPGFGGGTLIVTFEIGTNDPETLSTFVSFECPTMMSYPNPVSEELIVEVDNIQENSEIEIELYDSSGIKKKFKKTKQKKDKIDVKALQKGNYYLKVKVKGLSGNNYVIEDQIVVQ